MAKSKKDLNKRMIINITKNILHEYFEDQFDKISKKKFFDVIRRKNPYLFRSLGIEQTGELINACIESTLFASIETTFGSQFLEALVLSLLEEQYSSAKKCSSTGIDLEFIKDETTYLIAVKSGPHTFNSAGLKQQGINFSSAQKVFKTGATGRIKKVECIIGYTFGSKISKKTINIQNGVYEVRCGQDFWKFITGSELAYSYILEAIGNESKWVSDKINKLKSELVSNWYNEWEKNISVKLPNEVPWDDILNLVSLNKSA